MSAFFLLMWLLVLGADDRGGGWDPNGLQSGDYSGGWDPNGRLQSGDRSGGWDPNG